MDFLKLIVFRIFMRYPLFRSREPHSTATVPFGSVTTNEQGYFSESHCIRLGFKKYRVLPEPDPPITSTFLFRAVFGSFGRLFIVRLSVAVKITLFWGSGSMNGSMSSLVPHRAEPYSSSFRNFFRSFPFRYTASHIPPAMATPRIKSSGYTPGWIVWNADRSPYTS